MIKYFQAPWTKKETLILTLAPVVALGLISLTVDTLELKEALLSSNYKAWVIFGSIILQGIIILAPLFSLRKHRASAKHLGIKKIPVGQGIQEVLAHYLLYFGIAALIGIIIAFTQVKIPGFQAQPSIIPAFGDSTSAIIIATFTVVIIAPIIEEIFFRGFLMRTLVNHYKLYLGSIASAAIFALFHLQPNSIIPLFIVGLLLNSIVIRTKSILPAIGFHMLFNGISLAAQYILYQQDLPIDKILG